MSDKTDITARLRQYEGQNFETTACYNGLRDEAAHEIDRLRQALADERERERCAMVAERWLNCMTEAPLLLALAQAGAHTMTPEEIEAQRRSWLIGQTGFLHPDWSQEKVENYVDHFMATL